jgi:hypothetical protein
MKTDQDHTTVDRILTFIQRVLASPDLQTKIKDTKTAEALLMEEGLPESARDHLLEIMNYLDDKKDFDTAGEELSPTPLNQQDQSRGGYNDLAKTVMASFDYVARSFWISLSMSVVIFLMGMGFLLAALLKAFGERDASTSTLTLAGVGLANFLLLFYKGPWKDIAANLVNTERVRTATMSYLSTMSYIGQLRQGIAPLQAINEIRDLTRETVRLLENVPKQETRRPSKRAPSTPSSSSTAPSDQAPSQISRPPERFGGAG